MALAEVRIHDETVRAFRELYSYPYKGIIRFLGLWDTVAGPILEAVRNDLQLTLVVQKARQALAMNEKRAHFEPQLWISPPDVESDQQQVWFVGDHGDIGGGHPDNRTLANITLLWMAEEAKHAGLSLKEEALRAYEADSSSFGLQHNSLDERLLNSSCTWRAFGIHRRQPLQTSQGESLHLSVFERYGKPAPVIRKGLDFENGVIEEYRPSNLTHFLVAFSNFSKNTETYSKDIKLGSFSTNDLSDTEETVAPDIDLATHLDKEGWVKVAKYPF